MKLFAVIEDIQWDYEGGRTELVSVWSDRKDAVAEILRIGKLQYNERPHHNKGPGQKNVWSILGENKSGDHHTLFIDEIDLNPGKLIVCPKCDKGIRGWKPFTFDDPRNPGKKLKGSKPIKCRSCKGTGFNRVDLILKTIDC